MGDLEPASSLNSITDYNLKYRVERHTNSQTTDRL